MINNIFYQFKPFIPRCVQLFLRRKIALKKRSIYSGVWPIDNSCGRPPGGWKGWPDGKRFALILTHDVETQKGHDKCRQLMKLEDSLGLRSSFNFVPKRYNVSPGLRHHLTNNGFEVGVHGLLHDGKYFQSLKIFKERAIKINQYLKEWNAVGFRSPSMQRNLEWFNNLNIEYDSSTFDTDPFEPQSDGIGTIFPLVIQNKIEVKEKYIELPYTLPQDHTLFIILRENNIDTWKRKLDWVVEHGGMVLLNTHPDYMNFGNNCIGTEEYPTEYYRNFLEYIKSKYEGQYWHVLPKKIARFWRESNLNTSLVIKTDSRQVNESPNPIRDHLPLPKRRRAIRVCMLAYTFYESDNRVRRYAETLAKRGDEVDIIALRQKGQSAYTKLNGINVYRIQRRVINEGIKLSYLMKVGWFLFNSFGSMALKHMRKPYDLIHVHSVPDFEVFAALIPRLTGAKVILDIHDLVPEFYADKFDNGTASLTYKILKLLEKYSIAFSNHVIISNHLWEKTLLSRSVKKDNCTTILNYPDPTIFKKTTHKKSADKFILMYPGTLNWHQGLDVAIKAMKIIIDTIPEVELHIYGDGPEKNALVRLSSDLELNDRVFFPGYLSLHEMAAKMAEADIGVVPKRAASFGNEAFSTKTLEFMELGVPVIVANTKIDKFYFNDTMVTFFQSEDEKDLADKMLQLIKNKTLRDKLTSNSSKYIKKNNWEVKKSMYINLVDSLIEQHK